MAIIRSEVYGYLVPARRNLGLLLCELPLHPHSKRQCFGRDTMHVGGADTSYDKGCCRGVLKSLMWPGRGVYSSRAIVSLL